MFTLAAFNEGPVEEISIFPDCSELPSIESLPLDRGGKAFKKKKGYQSRVAEKFEQNL